MPVKCLTLWIIMLAVYGRIPASAFFLHHINYLSQREMRCDLYKCGDLLAKPHYMSWNPVHSEKPNFHRPQDFDTCIFT